MKPLANSIFNLLEGHPQAEVEEALRTVLIKKFFDESEDLEGVNFRIDCWGKLCKSVAKFHGGSWF